MICILLLYPDLRLALPGATVSARVQDSGGVVHLVC